MAVITGNLNFPTSKQVPDHAILDQYNKQTYLGNSFVYTTSQTIAGTSETPIILLTNPASNTKSLFFNLRKLTCTTASHSAIFNFYSAPTISANGTAQTPINFRPASATTSSMNIYLSPTISSNGSLMSALISANQTPDVSSVLVVLDPGQSLLTTVTVSNANDKVISEFGWYEI